LIGYYDNEGHFEKLKKKIIGEEDQNVAVGCAY
jgi:hypothetical protein